MSNFEINPYAPGNQLKIETIGIKPMGPYKIGVCRDDIVTKSYVKIPLDNLAFPEILKMIIETNEVVEVRIKNESWMIYLG
jgi:hypothetical protein